MIPKWLHLAAWCALAVGFACAAAIAVDEGRRPQKMWIMNIVWPTTALFGHLLILWFYFAQGRAPRREDRTGNKGSHAKPPLALATAKGALHCGAGCSLGDIAAEWLAFLLPGIATWFGLGWLFGEKTFAVWVLDFVFAFGLGIAFQYFTIAPMRQLGVRQGLVAAVKADALSLTAWQLGMYGFMAIAQFLLFRRTLGAPLEVNTAEFWFMMQIAMICGFVTSYPVNWLLIRKGLKERM